MRAPSRFPAAAWAFVGYLLIVILFGAWVRITHSGAGCGSHWPTCNGEIVPLAPSIETTIEYTHRLTSGLCGVFGLILVVWAWRAYGAGHRVFQASAATFVLLMVEAGIGAGLVLRELVADNDSAARALAVAIHLTNTLLLTGAAAYTAWRAGGGDGARFEAGRPAGAFAAALVVLAAVSMTGAITALGDTLFPTEAALGPGLLEKVRGDLSAANHFLVRLRVVHPLVAVLGALFLLWLLAPGAAAKGGGWARAGLLAVGAQTLIGLANVALSAPGWLQLVHLAFAHAVWIATLLAALEAAPAARAAPARVAHA